MPNSMDSQEHALNWPTILSKKSFWIYYLRWFQSFMGDRVAACCAFFDTTPAELGADILNTVYQVNIEDATPTFHTFCLPLMKKIAIEIEFQNFGPNEYICLTTGGETIPLANVDVDDVHAPLFPLRTLPRIIEQIEDPIAHTYGALLLYKLTYVIPTDDLNTLPAILQMVLPPNLFNAHEQARILAIEQHNWQLRQKHPRLPLMIEHPAWQTFLNSVILL